MNYMFDGCSKLTSLDLSSFNTSQVTNMSYMFRNCSKLTSLDVSSFNTSQVTNMSYMFYGYSALTTIYVSELWDTTKVTSSSSMFRNCTNLVGGNGTKYSSSYTDKTYARIDKPGQAGYLTDISAKSSSENVEIGKGPSRAQKIVLWSMLIVLIPTSISLGYIIYKKKRLV